MFPHVVCWSFHESPWLLLHRDHINALLPFLRVSQKQMQLRSAHWRACATFKKLVPSSAPPLSVFVVSLTLKEETRGNEQSALTGLYHARTVGLALLRVPSTQLVFPAEHLQPRVLTVCCRCASGVVLPLGWHGENKKPRKRCQRPSREAVAGCTRLASLLWKYASS